MVLLAANPNSTGTYKYHSRPSPNTQLEETQIYDLLSALCKSLKSYRDNLPSCAREKQVDTGAQNQMGCPYGIWSKSPKTVPYNFSSKNLGITLLLLLPKCLNTRMGGGRMCLTSKKYTGLQKALRPQCLAAMEQEWVGRTFSLPLLAGIGFRNEP